MDCLQRIAIATSLCLALAGAAPGMAQAQQKFPVKPIRLVVAFTPGGTTDILARMVSQGMSETFGQPLVIENRPGAGGVLAAALVAKAPPDGYTLLATSAALLISAVLSSNAQYDPLKDFAPVAELGYSTTVLVRDAVSRRQDGEGARHARQHEAGEASVRLGRRRQLDPPFRGAVQARRRLQGPAHRVQGPVRIPDRDHCRAHTLRQLGIDRVAAVHQGRQAGGAGGGARRSAHPCCRTFRRRLKCCPAGGRDGSQAWLAPAGTPRAVRQQISGSWRASSSTRPISGSGCRTWASTSRRRAPEEHEKNMRTDYGIFSRLVVEAGLKPK